MKICKPKDQFSFELDDQKLKEAQRLTPIEILRWLAEANAFFNKVLSPEQKKIWKKLREGKL